MKRIISVIGALSFFVICNAAERDAAQAERAEKTKAFVESLQKMTPEERAAAIKSYRAEIAADLPQIPETSKEERDAKEAEVLDRQISAIRKDVQAQTKKSASEIKGSSSSELSTDAEYKSLILEVLELRRSTVGKSPEEKAAAMRNWSSGTSGKRMSELRSRMNEESQARTVSDLRERIKVLERSKSAESARSLEVMKFQLELLTATPEKRRELLEKRRSQIKASVETTASDKK